MYLCRECNSEFSTGYNLKRHFKSKHDPTFEGFSCPSCTKNFTTRHYLKNHTRKCNAIVQRGGMIPEPHSDFEEGSIAPATDSNLKSLYKENWGAIKTYFKCRQVVDFFNFRLINQKHSLKAALTDLWVNKVTSQVKLQCSLGMILQNTVTREFRYYHSSANNTNIFQSPVKIKSLADLMEVCDVIIDMDLTNKATSARPSSSWCLHTITNLSFALTKTDFPKFGSPPTTIPPHIKKLKCVHTLLSDGNTRFSDNLCFFRALALRLHCKCTHRCYCLRTNNAVVMSLFKRYTTSIGVDANSDSFTGISLDELVLLEKIFDLKITVYSLSKSHKSTIMRQSYRNGGTCLDLCAAGRHFMWIKSLASFTKCFQCSYCSESFRTKFTLLRHRSGCARKKSRLVYGKDNFHPPSNIFEQIEDSTNLVVSEKIKFYPFRATFDIECYLPKSVDKNTPKLTFTNDHHLMSISICSNIPGFDTPICLVSNGDSDLLVEKFVMYLEHLSDVASSLCQDKIQPLIDQLEQLRDKQVGVEKEFETQKWSNPFIYKNRSVDALIDKVRSYFQELPVISFNGQKYDLNVMRAPLIRHLSKQDKILFAIKRNNAMKAIKTKKLKLLDITNYIAPGYSYDAFIKAYGCVLTKGYFPFEYVDSLDRLNDTCLPQHSSFFSNLRQCNISLDQYNYCANIWRQNNMSTLADFLMWYNNLDVLPFLEAIEKQHMVYRAKGIDMFKDAVSVPTLATKWLFMESDTNEFSIPLITKKNSDLHQTIRENLVGGPAIVFHRYHEKGKTFIKQARYGAASKPCQQILGYDANALYLYAAMQELPTGSMIRRKKLDNFRPVFSDYYGRLAHEWLGVTAYINNVSIRHKYNKGEVSLGQHSLPVDGFCKSNNTVYQFHGCIFHGCQSPRCEIVNGQIRNPINNKLFTDLLQDTLSKENYLRQLGYHVVTIWECEWQHIKKRSDYISSFVNEMTYREMSERKPMTESEIIDAVRAKRFFGFVECDIHVPPNLRQMFSEMPPIFKNTSISRNDLSPHMLEFAIANKLYSQPQKSLIGSMFGKKILLLSTLLQWYLSRGLVVSQVHQIVQFKATKCFQKFGEGICDTRRSGDSDISKKIIAETAKLTGNVVYGTTITNKERFTDVKFTSSPKKATQFVNNKRFISIDELDEDVFEIQMAKSKIHLNTPVVLGFAILQVAKLRMLQFYFDFMHEYFHDSDFQYVCMDTDSAYFAMSGALESVVKPSKRSDFYHNYDKWFVPPFCSHHKNDFIQCKLAGIEWEMGDCCMQAFNFHKRSPGLFKEEFSGSGIVALNAKTYHCYGHNGTKTSAKGVMKRLNNFQKGEFLSTLFSKKSVFGLNRGIMRRNNRMVTYSQMRSGLSYFYAKRLVKSDGVSTSPLCL